MSGWQVASNSGSALALASTPVQILKLVKPAAGRTDNFHASFDGSVKIDFTAIANEQVTFFHDSKNQSLHVIFADGSQIVIEPFFDSMGVMSNFVFEMAPGEVLDSAQFVSQFPITRDQSVLPALTDGPTESGAEFNDPSIDSLPPNIKLALLPPEELPTLVFHETIPAPFPTAALPTVPPSAAIEVTDSEALANEAGLPGIGSDAASNSEIFNGSITASGGTGPYTFTLNSPATGSHGTLLLNADGTYTYTLTSPFDTTPDSATTATQTEQNKDSFSYTVTDAHGNSTTGTIVVDIIDDVPTAHVDSGDVTEGSFLAVAASGVLSNDVAGADGFTASGGVVGVRAVGNDLTTDVTTGVNTPIAGLHGTLVLQANGGYIYQSTANDITADTTDVFVYTVKDGDGDLSTTTLTINLANVTVSATDTDALVNEAGLPVIGSDAASDSEIFNGSITPSGGIGPYTFTLNSPAIGSHGTLVLNAADGTYTYTLTSPFDTTPDADNGTNPEVAESFQYTVTDANGVTATGTILVAIIDDVPQATNDGPFTVPEGTPLLITTALANDLFGADGVDPVTGGAVTTAAAKGVAVYNGDGTFTYTATRAREGLIRFRNRSTTREAVTSTATVTVNLGTDSVPSLVGSASNLTVDEDGFANAANDTVTARTDETASTGLLTQSGTAVVNFGSDVPANLLGSIVLVDTPALDGQLTTHDGQSVTFALEAATGDLVGSAGATAVIRIHLVSA